MATEEKTKEQKREGRYDDTRRAFEELSPEEQARFLLEATASSLMRGIEFVAGAVADEMESAVRKAREKSEEAASDAENEPKEPPADAEASGDEATPEDKSNGGP